MDLATLAQLVAAVANTAVAVTFGVGYYLFIKQNREMLEQNHEMLEEMRASRTAGGRPQIVVEADYSHMPMLNIVVRNVGGGAAKDVEFGFSAPLVVSKLPYFKEGINFLESGEEVTSPWGTFDDLVTSLRERELEDGVMATVWYRDLAGDSSYEDKWNINPLLYEDESIVVGGHRGMSELVEAVEKLCADVEKASEGLDALVRDQAR